MADGIERNSAEQTGSGIAAQIGHPGVRRLVDADREEKRDQLKHDVHVVQGHARLASILTRGAAIPAVSSANRAHRKRCKSTRQCFSFSVALRISSGAIDFTLIGLAGMPATTVYGSTSFGATPI